MAFPLFGLVTGSNYAFRVVLACNAFPKYPATVIAVSTLSFSVGTAVIHVFLGYISDTVSYSAGMFASSLFLLASALPLILCYKGKKARKSA